MSLYLIAEIGINHNGDLAIARRLIDAAAEAGFDAVKFQKRTIDAVYTAEFLDSPRESPWGTTQRDQKEGLEFGRADYEEIAAHCRENMAHFKTPGRIEFVDALPRTATGKLKKFELREQYWDCLLYTSPSPRDGLLSRMPSSA